jgi:4-hydroxy-tetrahydrodipicolinate synthase
MAIFEGSGVAIITPMNEDGSVNYAKLDELLEEQIANETDAIIICGTTGESATLSVEEHLDVIRHTIKTVNHRIPVVAGTGSNDTACAIAMSKEAEEAGADGLLVVTPYYNKATQRGLIAHYTAIANAVTLPIIMYNVPSRTSVNIAPETAAYLGKNVKNIVAIKAASGSLSQIAKTKHLAGDALDIYSGDDDETVPILSIGGIGVISVLANVAPKYTHDMVRKYLDGDVKESAKMQLDAIPIINALFCEVNPIPVKEAMNLMGKEVGPYRLPMYEIAPENREVLRQAMKDFGLLA